MVNPVSMSSPNVYFRQAGEGVNAQPNSTVAQTVNEGDQLELSDKSKKGGFLKTAGIILGSAVALLGASFGLAKTQMGQKWLTSEASGVMASVKKWLAKPGDFLNNKVYEPLANFVTRGKAEKTEEIVEEIIDDIPVV